MPVSKAQQKAVNKYMAANYDRINLTVPKGKKETIQDHAAACGQSVNAYINEAIDDRMARETPPISQNRDKGPQDAPESTGAGGVVSLPFHAIKAAQEAAEAAGEAVPQFVARAVETQAKRDETARKLGGRPKTLD